MTLFKASPQAGLCRASVLAFSLVEMLVSIGIIGILTALALTAGKGVLTETNRKAAASEIVATVTALDAYKTDNGTYPISSTLLPSSYLGNDGRTKAYWQTSQILFKSLSGQTNYMGTATPGVKAYMDFKPAMVATTNGGSYIVDPWGYSLGYSTGSSTVNPTAGPGFYDLWSTGGVLSTAVNTNDWIGNCTVSY